MKTPALLLCVLTPLFVFAQDRISNQNGDWNNGTTWSPTGVPLDGESILIQNGHTVEIDGTPDITLEDVQITIEGVLDMDNDGGDIGNLNLLGNSGILIADGGRIEENLGLFQEIFSSITLNGVTLWTGCSNGICVDIANDLLEPDPELNGSINGFGEGILLPLSDNPLPVEYVYFNALTTETGVTLQWKTATELNNSHFEVERSLDNKEFYRLGDVAGFGTTNVPQDYLFVDPNPLFGVTYYRLKQVDHDGAFEYSKTVVAHSEKQVPLSVRVFPNPASDYLTIESNRPLQFQVLELLDGAGQRVADFGHSTEGHGFGMTLELPELNAGVYLLRFKSTDGNTGVQRLMIE